MVDNYVVFWWVCGITNFLSNGTIGEENEREEEEKNKEGDLRQGIKKEEKNISENARKKNRKKEKLGLFLEE